MKRLAIIGSGHLGQQISHLVREDKQFEVVGYFDDYQTKGTLINSIPILGKVADIIEVFDSNVFDVVLIGIGYKHLGFKKDLYSQLKDKVPFAKFIHSSTVIDSSVKIGNGTIIYPGCVIDQNIIIEENVLINIGCSLAHDGLIGAHSFISPRVAIAGFVIIGESCILGINTTIIDNIAVIDNVHTGGGTVIVKNIENSGLYVGNPARFIR